MERKWNDGDMGLRGGAQSGELIAEARARKTMVAGIVGCVLVEIGALLVLMVGKL